ncbi:MAG TPA: tetratricopeptide repeat protein, partial [candidate division Zixibacteria bacterium]|nr:tetratricopeptide repeat protein [candidate division Zixibacteria bacterium]
MKMLRRFLLIGLALAVCAGHSFAGITEQPQPDTAATDQLSPDQVRQQYQQKINFCRQLMNQGNFQGASALLETIYAAQPTNSLVINMLMQCYESLQYYPKAEDMIKRQLALFPGNVNFQVTYAELLAKQGKKDE